jgi:hypothetical protein
MFYRFVKWLGTVHSTQYAMVNFELYSLSLWLPANSDHGMFLKDERIFRLVKEGSLPGYKVWWVNQQKLQQYLHGGNMHILPK